MTKHAFDGFGKQILHISQRNDLFFLSKTDFSAQNLKQTVAYVTKFNGLKYLFLNHAGQILLIYE